MRSGLWCKALPRNRSETTTSILKAPNKNQTLTYTIHTRRLLPCFERLSAAPLQGALLQTRSLARGLGPFALADGLQAKKPDTGLAGFGFWRIRLGGVMGVLPQLLGAPEEKTT